jgi:hypothetical protein
MKKSNDPNSMNLDDFEKQLQRQPMRSLPAEWRAEIIATAKSAPCTATATRSQSFLSAVNVRLSAVLWPCPQAWAGLGMVWLMILAVNFVTEGKVEQVAKTMPRPSAEIIMALREQKRELAKLIEPFSAQLADPPKTNPSRPRSERRISVVAV